MHGKMIMIQSQYYLYYMKLQIVIGLKIIDRTLYNNFMDGKDVQPLLDILDIEDFGRRILVNALSLNESFENEDKKKKISVEEKINELYNAIFIKHSDENYIEYIGIYTFDNNSKKFILNASNMMTDYTSFEM